VPWITIRPRFEGEAARVTDEEDTLAIVVVGEAAVPGESAVRSEVQSIVALEPSEGGMVGDSTPTLAATDIARVKQTAPGRMSKG